MHSHVPIETATLISLVVTQLTCERLLASDTPRVSSVITPPILLLLLILIEFKINERSNDHDEVAGARRRTWLVRGVRLELRHSLLVLRLLLVARRRLLVLRREVLAEISWKKNKQRMM